MEFIHLKSIFTSGLLVSLLLANLAYGKSEKDLLAPFEKDRESILAAFNSPQLPTGIFVSFGGERSFIHASLSDKFTAIYHLVWSDSLFRFSLVNRALLIQSKGSVEKYRHLRVNASREEWAAEMLTTFDWWNQNVRKDAHFDGLHTKTNGFETENYLFDEQLYSRLYQLSRKTRLIPVQFYPAENWSYKILGDSLHYGGVPISVFDGGTMWRQSGGLTATFKMIINYMGAAKARGSIFYPDSLIMMSVEHQGPIGERPKWIWVGGTYRQISEFFNNNTESEFSKGLKEFDVDGYQTHLNSIPKIELPYSGPKAKPEAKRNWKRNVFEDLVPIRRAYIAALCSSFLKKPKHGQN